MARIELLPGVGEDFERILEYFTTHQIADGISRVTEIIHAIGILEHNPLIGRPTRNDQRELIIGRRSQGYVALYRYFEKADLVIILAVRSQREAGYARQ